MQAAQPVGDGQDTTWDSKKVRQAAGSSSSDARRLDYSLPSSGKSQRKDVVRPSMQAAQPVGDGLLRLGIQRHTGFNVLVGQGQGHEPADRAFLRGAAPQVHS